MWREHGPRGEQRGLGGMAFVAGRGWAGSGAQDRVHVVQGAANYRCPASLMLRLVRTQIALTHGTRIAVCIARAQLRLASCCMQVLWCDVLHGQHSHRAYIPPARIASAHLPHATTHCRRCPHLYRCHDSAGVRQVRTSCLATY